MRFFLDNDVSAEVSRFLHSEGHEAWTCREAGLATAVDDDLTVYASNQKAALLTHDVEFSQRRRKNVIGQHIWLACDEWRAADLLGIHLQRICPVLTRNADVWIKLSTGTDPNIAFDWD